MRERTYMDMREDYSRMTREQLIARVESLEKRVFELLSTNLEMGHKILQVQRLLKPVEYRAYEDEEASDGS